MIKIQLIFSFQYLQKQLFIQHGLMPNKDLNLYTLKGTINQSSTMLSVLILTPHLLLFLSFSVINLTNYLVCLASFPCRRIKPLSTGKLNRRSSYRDCKTFITFARLNRYPSFCGNKLFL